MFAGRKWSSRSNKMPPRTMRTAPPTPDIIELLLERYAGWRLNCFLSLTLLHAKAPPHKRSIEQLGTHMRCDYRVQLEYSLHQTGTIMRSANQWISFHAKVTEATAQSLLTRCAKRCIAAIIGCDGATQFIRFCSIFVRTQAKTEWKNVLNECDSWRTACHPVRIMCTV